MPLRNVTTHNHQIGAPIDRVLFGLTHVAKAGQHERRPDAVTSVTKRGVEGSPLGEGKEARRG